LSIKHTHLYPHVDGVANLKAYGAFSLFYKHPDDLHFIPVFDHVSIEFIRGYLGSRQWCREAVDAGWQFTCCLSAGLHMEGVTIQ
jgi:hypothetical protein